MKAGRIQAVLGFLRPQITFPKATKAIPAQQRWAHTKGQLQAIPPTIPFVPNVETFLTLIGRGLRQHAPKFPTWEALFSLSSEQLQELGIEPPRTRRYLLRWRQRYQEGRYGPGGDLKHVVDGIAVLGVAEVAKNPIARARYVVNIAPGQNVEDIPREELHPVAGYKVKGVRTIEGPHALPLKGGGAQLTVTEGLWEDKRGRKIDGGERRRAEVRFKRKVAERKALRERQGYY